MKGSGFQVSGKKKVSAVGVQVSGMRRVSGKKPSNSGWLVFPET
jgi:hypothetical protein